MATASARDSLALTNSIWLFEPSGRTGNAGCAESAKCDEFVRLAIDVNGVIRPQEYCSRYIGNNIIEIDRCATCTTLNSDVSLVARMDDAIRFSNDVEQAITRRVDVNLVGGADVTDDGYLARSLIEERDDNLRVDGARSEPFPDWPATRELLAGRGDIIGVRDTDGAGPVNLLRRNSFTKLPGRTPASTGMNKPPAWASKIVI